MKVMSSKRATQDCVLRCRVCFWFLDFCWRRSSDDIVHRAPALHVFFILWNSHCDGAITATDGVTELFQGRISVNEK